MLCAMCKIEVEETGIYHEWPEDGNIEDHEICYQCYDKIVNGEEKMKLDIKKNEENTGIIDVYSGSATRNDGHNFSFDIYQQTPLIWNVEYCINFGGKVIEKGIEYKKTMLEAFVWASDTFRDWIPDGY